MGRNGDVVDHQLSLRGRKRQGRKAKGYGPRERSGGLGCVGWSRKRRGESGLRLERRKRRMDQGREGAAQVRERVRFPFIFFSLLF
jgi:hypothetical protein